jgi:hypothetical protein
MASHYGLLGGDALQGLNGKIEQLIQGGVSSAQQKGLLSRLFKARDAIIARQGAAQAQMAIPGGGLASSGIRGIDVIEHEFTPGVITDHNMSGDAQGQRYTSQAPPGSGRLVPVPFVAAGAVNPGQNLTGGAAGLVGAVTPALVTTAINWAIVRIVAATTQTFISGNGAAGVMQDLRIGGSPNLFLVEDWVIMEEYDIDRDSNPGLRAYPVLRSPNTGLITVGCRSGTGAADVIVASVSLIVEVLRDDAFGPGIPGPYAR